MRITKMMLNDMRSKLIESQAKLCSIAKDGKGALDAEFKRRHPHYIGTPPDNPMETLRELLYDDLARILLVAGID